MYAAPDSPNRPAGAPKLRSFFITYACPVSSNRTLARVRSVRHSPVGANHSVRALERPLYKQLVAQ